jgi:ABC-type branched-subunit amino acid transport system substrate-binding protein
MAILSGVHGIPQISYSATSTDFDNKEQHPLLARSCPSSVGEARASVNYLKFLGYSYVAVLSFSDPFGSAFQVSFQDYAAKIGITTYSVPFPYPADGLGHDISSGVDSLKMINVRAFFVSES